MVRGSISESERRAWNRVLGLAFVLVVGGSAGLMAVAGGAPLPVAAGLSAGGLVAGTGLVYYLSTLSMDTTGDREYRRR